ncbi:MAG: hypothetical protein OEV42_03310 [Deltaproteobacteria bacterium]|nr:hypothetical protein [Deltaproteobacteria bacterium]
MRNKALKNIGNELKKGNIIFSYVNDDIHVLLPNNFGILEISIWKDDEDSIQLLEGDYHTHGDIEAREYGLTREKAIRRLIEDIYNGKLFLVEIFEEGYEPEKTIIKSLDYVQKNVEYKLYNKI